MATVKVNMSVCEKKHEITVTPSNDGMFDVLITSDCEHVDDYKIRVAKISMDDITDMKVSKIVSYESTMVLTPTCLLPKAVLYAAWIETGLISEKRARDAKENTVLFE